MRRSPQARRLVPAGLPRGRRGAPAPGPRRHPGRPRRHHSPSSTGRCSRRPAPRPCRAATPTALAGRAARGLARPRRRPHAAGRRRGARQRRLTPCRTWSSARRWPRARPRGPGIDRSRRPGRRFGGLGRLRRRQRLRRWWLRGPRQGAVRRHGRRARRRHRPRGLGGRRRAAHGGRRAAPADGAAILVAAVAVPTLVGWATETSRRSGFDLLSVPVVVVILLGRCRRRHRLCCGHRVGALGARVRCRRLATLGLLAVAFEVRGDEVADQRRASRYERNGDLPLALIDGTDLDATFVGWEWSRSAVAAHRAGSWSATRWSTRSSTATGGWSCTSRPIATGSTALPARARRSVVDPTADRSSASDPPTPRSAARASPTSGWRSKAGVGGSAARSAPWNPVLVGAGRARSAGGGRRRRLRGRHLVRTRLSGRSGRCRRSSGGRP